MNILSVKLHKPHLYKFTNNAGIPAPTAAKFTKRLLDIGYLVTREEASGRRPALYSFEPLMKLVRI